MKLFDLLPQHWRTELGSGARTLDSISLAGDCNPDRTNIFRAFELPISQLKVCIVGQDPYPNPEHAMGLSFSVPNSVTKLPPTLRNIFQEMKSDLGIENRKGDLTPWHNQGVFLMNRVLTTEPGISQAHKGIGWESFTNEVVKFLATKDIVFILWGASAAELEKYIDYSKVIRSAHPSPLSAYRGFFGSKPFSRSNQILRNLGLNEIDWQT